MRLLWTLMGYSRPYAVFAGLGEVSAGLLLLSRRTSTIGALISFGVMLNVVMLNFCYDVPVKQFSSHLVLAALFVAWPDLQGMFDLARSSGSLSRATTTRKRSPCGTSRTISPSTGIGRLMARMRTSQVNISMSRSSLSWSASIPRKCCS